MTNSTPDTPHTSPTKLAAMKLGELRAHARKLRIEGADELHKPELLAKVKEHHYVSEVSSMKLGELRAHARKLGIDGADELHKPELLAKVKDHRYAQARDGQHREGSGGGASGGRRPTAREVSSMKLGELRAHARKLRIEGADELHKPELLAKVKEQHYVSEVSGMKLGELRAHARKLGLDGADELHKPELLAKVKDHRYAQAHGGKPRNGSGGGSTGGGGMTASADQDRGGSPTPDTPDVSETKPAALKVDEQRAPMPRPRNDEADELREAELPARVVDTSNPTEDAQLFPREEERHHTHSGLDDATTTGRATGTTGTTRTPDFDRGRDASGPITEDALSGLQERLNVGPEAREADRARLGKPVVTELDQVSVPVSGDELIVERGPIIQRHRDGADDGITMSGEQRERVLRGGRPVVEWEALAVDHARLGTGAGSEESGETVGAEVGEEEGIGVDADGPNVRGQ
jgi:stress response protein YsnF